MNDTNISPQINSIVVLDLDDTLYLERDYVLSGFRAVGAWLEQHHGLHGFFELARRHFEAGRRTDIFDAALAEFVFVPPTGLVTDLVTRYREHEPQLELLRDAADFLERPRQGRVLALVTDGFLIAQRNKIRALMLEEVGVFPVICTDVWGRDYWKPHTRAFQHIQAHFGIAAEACVYIGDNPEKDFIAPRRLGWRTIRIRRDGGLHADVPDSTEHGPDLIIASFAELTEARLDELFAASRRSPPCLAPSATARSWA